MGSVLAVDGLANVRDLGGIPRNDGSLTPAGVFVRAEKPDRITPSGWAALRDHRVHTVVDLRRPEEQVGPVPDGIHRVRVDLDGDERDFWDPIEADGRWGTPLYYAAHLHELPHRLVRVLTTIASAPDGAVLFHCAAGWDRTGLVAAVLLKAVDATEDAAAADYLTSYANADALAALHGRSSDVELRLGVLARFGHTPESAFREMYRHLDVDAWFQHAGVDEHTARAIRTWRGHIDAR